MHKHSYLCPNRQITPLSGTVTVAGDKSLSHRSLIFAAMATGRTIITGLLPSEDVDCTKNALASLGVSFTNLPDGTLQVDSNGYDSFGEPDNIWDMGNSGTSARLLMGLVCNLPIKVFMTGDSSLRKRPMRRVIEPLSQFGCNITARRNGLLPLLIKGTDKPTPINYRLPVASAQVKSAILLAGLMCGGETTVIEPELSRDHTERLLSYYNIPCRIDKNSDGYRRITVTGFPEINAKPLTIIADPSSAAFLIVAALITAGSKIILPNVGLNPLRTGLIDTLLEMGGDISITDKANISGEDVGTIIVKGSKLHGVTIPAQRAPSMIDEYPILSVAASFATGTTIMNGLNELTVKESNRLQAILDGLSTVGATVNGNADSITIQGQNNIKGGCTLSANLDHRMAMSFFVMGMRTDNPIKIMGWESIYTSFPNFLECMHKIGAQSHQSNII